MPISRQEKAMKRALQDAGRTIGDYVDPAPGDERDAEETLDQIIGEIDNDEVGRAIAQSDQAEGKPDTDRRRLIAEMRANPYTAKFADMMEAEDRAPRHPPLGKTGS